MSSSPTLRQKAYALLEHHNDHTPSSTWATILDITLVVLILLNALAVILESVDSIYRHHQDYFWAFEIFSLAIFLTEYVLRLWAVGERNDKRPWQARLKWATSFGALIDLLAILPVFLLGVSDVDLRFLRVFRLLRLFKLTRYFKSLRILLTVLEKERASFGAVVFILSLLIVMASSGIYLAEYESQPDTFNSIPHAMWWAVVTLTTVGYGDITPITPFGKFLGAIITILGVGLAALPAGILATGLTRELEAQKQASLYQLYDELMALPLEELHDNNKITAIADTLGIDRKNLQETLTQALREKRLLLKEEALAKREEALNRQCFCPYCGGKMP